MKFWVLLTAFLLCPVCLFISCSQPDNHADDDRLLARVYNKSLYLTDMEGMLAKDISSEDSSLIINKFVSNWVREASLLREAERNIPKDLDIDQLVEDYRASLIKHNYENMLVDKLLDSVITDQELMESFNKNKEQYKLESPIIRCRFVKAALNAPQLEEVKKWWKSNDAADMESLETWCKANATVHHLQDSTWYKVEDIGVYFPHGMANIDNLGSKEGFVKQDDEFIYLFRVLDKVEKSKIPPIAFVEDQLRIVILHKRKKELLENMKDKLYEEAMRKNGVSVFQ